MGSEIHHWVCSACVVNGTINDAILYVPAQHLSIKTRVWHERLFSLAHKPGFILSIVLSRQCATVVNRVKHCFKLILRHT